MIPVNQGSWNYDQSWWWDISQFHGRSYSCSELRFPGLPWQAAEGEPSLRWQQYSQQRGNTISSPCQEWSHYITGSPEVLWYLRQSSVVKVRFTIEFLPKCQNILHGICWCTCGAHWKWHPCHSRLCLSPLLVSHWPQKNKHNSRNCLKEGASTTTNSFPEKHSLLATASQDK